MRSILRIVCVAGVLVALLAQGALVAPSADGFADHFCNYVLYPGGTCEGTSVREWERVRTRYPGPQAHNVTGCVFMYSNAYRNNATYCARTWSEPTWNPIGHNYGPTGYPPIWWTYNWLPSTDNCCSHTLAGWASDNQTDG